MSSSPMAVQFLLQRRVTTSSRSTVLPVGTVKYVSALLVHIAMMASSGVDIEYRAENCRQAEI